MYKTYECKECGHEITAMSKPQSLKWSDGHVCHLVEVPEESNAERTIVEYTGDVQPELTEAELIELYLERQESDPNALRAAIRALIQRFDPDGFMLLEAVKQGSPFFGRRVMLAYGPRNTFTTVPAEPISPRGREDDLSVVIGVWRLK